MLHLDSLKAVTCGLIAVSILGVIKGDTRSFQLAHVPIPKVCVSRSRSLSLKLIFQRDERACLGACTCLAREQP